MRSSRTSVTLLECLRDTTDQSTWRRFDRRYRPMLIRFARNLGLDRHEAEEAAQRTVVAFCRAYGDGQYDRDKGRFKNWLLGIAQHEIADLYAEKARQPRGGGGRSSGNDVLGLVSDPGSLSAIWEEQWQTHVIRECFARAKERFTTRDVRIFRTLTTERRKIGEVAEEMNMSYTAVRHVKHRVLTFMRTVEAEIETGG